MILYIYVGTCTFATCRPCTTYMLCHIKGPSIGGLKLLRSYHGMWDWPYHDGQVGTQNAKKQILLSDYYTI